MAANSGSDGHGDNERFIQHENTSKIQSEGSGQDMRESITSNVGALLEPAVTPATTSTLTMIPVPTSMVRPK